MESILRRLVKPTSLTRIALGRDPIGIVRYILWKFLANPARTAWFYVRRPTLNAAGNLALRTLQAEGIIVAHSSEISSNAFPVNIEACKRELNEIRSSAVVSEMIRAGGDSSSGKSFLIQLVPFDKPLDADNPFLKVALDPNILRIVSNYMGLYPQLHSVGAWLNLPTDGVASHSQLWHRDPEDLMTVKVFVYLNDVSVENGPFSYIPDTHPFGKSSGVNIAHEHKRRISDQEMIEAFPQNNWKVCLGSSGTMIIADTVGFHRGGMVERGERLLITMTYTSGAPQSRRNFKLIGRPNWLDDPLQKHALR